MSHVYRTRLESGRRRERTAARLLVAAFLVIISVTVVGVPPANASCWATTHWTSTSPPNSASFTISSNSTCNDLQAAYTFSVSDYVKGWYLSSGTWRAGTAGYVWVSTADNGWDVLLTSIATAPPCGGKDTRTVRTSGTFTSLES